MKQLRFLLLLLAATTTLAQSPINFSTDTTTAHRVANRYQIAVPGGVPMFVPPIGGGATFSIASLAPVQSVNGSIGAVTITRSSLTGTQSATTITGLSGIATASVGGDVSIPASGTIATLVTVNGTTGTFGSAGTVPTVTVNGKGLVTSVVSTSITPSAIGAASTTDLLTRGGQKVFTLSNTTNGTVFIHNLATALGYSTPTMTAIVYLNGIPDYNVYAVAVDNNSVRLVTPQKADGTYETATGKLVVFVNQ